MLQMIYERFMDFVKKMRQHEATKNSIIIAGNVCTPEATEQIIMQGRYSEDWDWWEVYDTEDDWSGLSSTVTT